MQNREALFSFTVFAFFGLKFWQFWGIMHHPDPDETEIENDEFEGMFRFEKRMK